MILKRKDSYFKVLPVETVPAAIGRAPASSRSRPERLQLIDSEAESASECAGRAIESAMTDMIHALKRFECSKHSRFSAGWLTSAAAPENAAAAAPKPAATPARERPVLELVFGDRDCGEDVFHLPYDSEIRHLVSKHVIDSNYVPKYFISGGTTAPSVKGSAGRLPEKSE